MNAAHWLDERHRGAAAESARAGLRVARRRRRVAGSPVYALISKKRISKKAWPLVGPGTVTEEEAQSREPVRKTDS